MDANRFVRWNEPELSCTEVCAWIQRGGMKIFSLEPIHLLRIIELTEKYSDVPMDLADASLIVLSEEKKLNEIASIDSDFYIYRDIRNEYLRNVFTY